MKYFLKELALIKHDDIREQTIKVLEKVNEQFFEAAASSTGKYHPQYALGKGGLYRHTRAAVGIAACLLQLDMFQYFTPRGEDYIIAALILHDVCKSGTNWEGKYTKHEHPILAADLVRDVLGAEGEPDCEFIECVCPLIESHMGQWNSCKWSRITLPVPVEDREKFVHACDYLASRKFLEYVFDDEEEVDEDD